MAGDGNRSTSTRCCPRVRSRVGSAGWTPSRKGSGRRPRGASVPRTRCSRSSDPVLPWRPSPCWNSSEGPSHRRGCPVCKESLCGSLHLSCQQCRPTGHV